MKQKICCPHCQSNKIRRFSKTTQLWFCAALAVIGFGFFIVAATGIVGYYLFSLPLLAIGSIRGYKEYTDPVAKCECKECRKPFEYLLT